MITLKKSLGQHFLHDKHTIEKILALPEKQGLQRLLEIGPGGGALTAHLLAWEGIDFKAIEVDEEKVQYLLAQHPSLQGKLIQGDILNAEVPFQEPFSIIGNFPYNISSPILFKVLDWEPLVNEVVGMFQKEVAQRIASAHGSKAYGILSVLMQAFFSVSYQFDVHENCFTPPPKVKSGVLRLENLHNPYQITDKKGFTKFVKAAFGQRRKTLRNALKSYYPAEKLQADKYLLRAEQWSVSDFVAAFEEMHADG